MNLYPYFDNGTFESYAPPFSTLPSPAANNYMFGKSPAEAQAGGFSLGLYMGADTGFLNDISEFDFRLRAQFLGLPIVLVTGKRYIFKIFVKCRAIDQVGSDGVIISIATAPYSGLGTRTIIASDAYTTTYQFSSGIIWKTTTVGQLVAHGGWVELSCEFTEAGNNIFLYGRKDDVSGVISGEPLPPDGESWNANGKLFFDSGTLEEVVVCDLALGTPSYTKTDESIFEAENGSVTINATSSYVRSYAIDNIAGPYQSSNVFSGLAPGTYDFYIKDTNPEGCSQSILDVVILAADEPPPPPDPPVVGPAEIDAKPLNENNFVRWFGVTGYKNFNSLTFTNCCWDTPVGYRQQTEGRMNELRFAPIIVTNENFTFYVNFNIPQTDPTFTQWKIALVDHRGIIQDDIAILKRDLFDDGVTYNIYCDEILLSGVVVNRFYRFMIYDEVTEAIKFMSGEIQLLAIDKAPCESVRLQYRSSINLKGFRYEELPDFYNIHRIRFYRTDEQDEGTLDQYRAVSSGQLRNVAYELDRYIELEAYYFDDQAHRAAGVWQLHDINIINNKLYIVKQSYKREKAVTKSYYKGTIQMFEQAFSTQDRYSRFGNLTIENASDFLLGDEGSRIKI